MAVRVRVPLAAPHIFYLFFMRKYFFTAVSAISVIIISSCSSKLGSLSADNFSVDPTPLGLKGGQVEAVINGKFPEKYMKRNAVVTVVPELRYGNGLKVDGAGATFQGEKVMGNDQTISYRLGGRYSMKTVFDYVPEMLTSDMYLTFNARVGRKTVQVPAVKVSYGVVATSELYRQALASDGGSVAPDSFERIRNEKLDANVKFLINQATLRQSELQNNSVQEFVRLLKQINKDRGESLELTSIDVAAFASPEGGYSYNDRLANRRQEASEEYVRQQLKAENLTTDIDARYTAQDWEGFQQLVQASNIQDKEVILRVLSMYKDPEEREQQIRNMSHVFEELMDGVLPELRRARMTINYNVVGRSDEQIQSQYTADPSQLSVEEILYAATLTNNSTEKENIYRTAARLHDRDYRALNNLGVLAFNRGNNAVAKEFFQQALRVDPKAPEVFANLALMNLKEGNLVEAENNLSRAIDANGYNRVAATLNIAKGNYALAEQQCGTTASNTAALAQLLNKNYEQAIKTLDAVREPNALTSYLHAVVAARRGNKFAAKSYLKEAIEKDPTLKAYADNDLELSILK